MNAPTQNLRAHLRAATSAAHDLLDHSMRAAAGWTSRGDYIRFLNLQYAARIPVERWLSNYAPAKHVPPAQTPLIAQDLRQLGSAPLSQHDAADFTLHANSEGAALGVAWVLAGSALGNRSILKEVRRMSPDVNAASPTAWPTAFLSDPAMLAFWGELRRRIENPADIAEMDASTEAATAVFEHFLAHTHTETVSSSLATVPL